MSVDASPRKGVDALIVDVEAKVGDAVIGPEGVFATLLAEATVIAHLPGKGRLEGLMGAMRVRTPEGREFVLGSGFSDAQRRHPPAIGTVVSYRYRGLTATGLPRFATFRRAETP